MRNRKLLIVAGAILLLGVLFFTATVLAAETEGVYNWYCNSSSECHYVRNATGTGSYITSWANDAVIAYGGSGSGDYGVYASAFEGVRGYATGSNGYGTWGTAAGTYGVGAYGYGSGSSAYGGYFYSPYYIGVYGRGGTGGVGDYGGYFYGYDGVRVYTSMSSGYGVWSTVYGTYGRGIYAYASGTYGIGAYGYAPNYIGVYGYGDEYGVYGYGDDGVYGRTRLSNGEGVYGVGGSSYGQGVQGYVSGSYGDGVYGIAYGTQGWGLRAYASGSYARGVSSYAYGTGSWGGFFNSGNYRGLYANGASGWYDAYFPDAIYAGGTVVDSSGWSVVAQNVGAETLQPGDLVSFVAMDGQMSVEKANGANGGAIVGVVKTAYIMETSPVAIEGALPDGGEISIDEPRPEADEAPLPLLEKEEDLPEGVELPAAPEAEADVARIESTIEMAPALPAEAEGKDLTAVADLGHMAEGSVEPGGFMIVLVQGFTQVNVNASVEAGQWLVAGDIGVAAISERQLAWAERRGDVVIGRALQAAVDGQVWVYVNFR